MIDVLPTFFLVATGLCLSLTLLALWISVRGVLIDRHEPPSMSSNTVGMREALLQEKHSLLVALRELRSERDLGKVSEADFHDLELRHRERAREVLRELDEEVEPMRAKARALIDAALGASTAEPAIMPKAAPQSQATQCPACQVSNDADAVFCKKCGSRLQGEGA